MDHPEDAPVARPFTAVEFCAGYAGIHLGLSRAIPGLRLVALCEIEAFAVANLVAKMEAGLLDSAPIWTDLKTFPGRAFRDQVDLLVAGYPCQPFSAAGKRQGADDPRHLWPHIRNTVRDMRPRFCFFENVEGHISLGLSTVLSDLEEDGYRTAWGIFSAAEVGAPHQRKRVFILAVVDDDEGLQRRYGNLLSERARKRFAGESSSPLWPSRPGERQHCWEPPRVCDTKGIRLQKSGQESRHASEPPDGRSLVEAQPPLGRDADGSSYRLDHAELYGSCDNRVDELRLLGNGVVPATAERAWRVLSAELLADGLGS